MNFLAILNFFGGLALFLFGMSRMSEKLQLIAGSKIRSALKRLTSTPLRGAMVGMGFTALVQSSYATTVMMIGLVNAGIMTLNQAVGIIMGANIGTTITAQLIAFKLGRFAFLFVIAGVALMLTKRSRNMEHWSAILLGFGLLFVGLNFMTEAAIPLKESELAHSILARLSTNPILGILSGLVFTMILQSSAASIGIIIVLASAGLVGYEGAMYLVFGGNIGTTVTAWLAGIGANSTARRVALVHTLFNVMGTIIFGTLTYLGFYTAFINVITTGDVYLGENMARHIANGHTFFNILNTLFFLPFAGQLALLAEKIIPKKEEEDIVLGEPRHLNPLLLNDPDLAIGQAIKEMREMLNLVKTGIETSYSAFLQNDYRKEGEVEKIENGVDHLQREVTQYLVKVNQRTKSDNIIKKIPALLHTVNDIEKMGDYGTEISGILNNQVQGQKEPLTQEFLDMIADLHQKIVKLLDLSMLYLDDFDEEVSFKIIEMEARLKERHSLLREEILKRIQNGHCIAENGLNTIDYIDAVEMIGDKTKNLIEAGSHGFVYHLDLNGKIRRKA